MSDEVKEAKPGYKTSEFWLTTLATLVSIALASGAVGEGTQAEKVIGYIVMGLNVAGYSVSRGLAKK